MRYLVWATLWCLTFAEVAIAQVRAPILRIETGIHCGMIFDAGVDRAGRVLVTVGDDKTARIWSLPDLEPRGVLRPPIGPDKEGVLYAVAVSPDGSVAAVAGRTGSGLGTYSIFLFNLQTKHIVRRWGELPDIISALAFSPDGRRLAVGFSRTGGIRVLDLTGGEIFRDVQYLSTVNGLSFAPDGRLAATSDDKAIRLYDSTGRLLQKVDVHYRVRSPVGSERTPFRIAFSPDGRELAVGQEILGEIDILDGHTLALKAEPDTSGLLGRRLNIVAWSQDGETVYAGGGVLDHAGGHFRILGWGDRGRGKRKVAAGGFGQAIGAILPMLGGRLVGVSTSWDLAVVNESGTRISSREEVKENLAPASDLAKPEARFYVDRTGRTVVWSVLGSGSGSGSGSDLGQTWHRFDGSTLDSVLTSALPVGLIDWTNYAGNLLVTNWQNSQFIHPHLNMVKLALDPWEISRSVSVIDGQVLIGTDSYIRLFGPDGKSVWQQSVPDQAWRVNQTPDGRLAVAALGDGTIRWYRTDDGQELLALFFTRDLKRWVAFTPSGYYAASPGGEDLFGWQVDRGLDQAADFYPASEFRERFYRPDVIDRILDTADEAEAVALANAAAGRHEPTVSVAQILPPVVEVVSAPERFATTNVPIHIRTRTPADAPVTRLRVLVNGEIMASPRAAFPVAADGWQEQDFTLVLPPKDSKVDIFADNRNSHSGPVTLKFQWVGNRKVLNPGEQGTSKVHKPKLWVLAVGISTYRDPNVPQLSYATADAESFAKMLRAQQGKAYREVETKVLTDAQATRASVLAGLDWIEAKVGPGDFGIVFLAGHGFTMATDHLYYFGAADVDLKKLTDTGVPYTAIRDALVNFNLKGDGTRAVFFIDSCHAGYATGASLNAVVKASDGYPLNEELAHYENHVLVFASSKGDQFSWEEPKFAHGAFTEALLEGLGDQWKADSRGTGRVTYKDLDAWISYRVPEITQDRQTPRLMAPPGGVDDFVLGTK